MTMAITITIKIKIEIEIEIKIKVKINEHNEHKWNGLRWNLIYNCYCLKFNKLRLGDFHKEVLLLCSEIGSERIFIGGFHLTQVSLIITQVKNKIAYHSIYWVKKLKYCRRAKGSLKIWRSLKTFILSVKLENIRIGTSYTIYWSILPQGFSRINLHIIMERSNK